MYEFVAANHNPHVCRELSHAVVERVEEDEIAGAEVAWVHFDSRLELFGHRPRYAHTVAIEHIPDEPAAIETGRIAAADDVRGVALVLREIAEDTTREKVHAAQIDLETAQAAFKYRYSVLTPAQLPKRAASPNVPAVLLVTFIAAVLGAIGAAVGVDLRSRRLVERWQIRRLLDRPILGEIGVPRLPRHGGP